MRLNIFFRSVVHLVQKQPVGDLELWYLYLHLTAVLIGACILFPDIEEASCFYLELYRMTTFPPFVLKSYCSNVFGNTLNKHRKLVILARHNFSKFLGRTAIQGHRKTPILTIKLLFNNFELTAQLQNKCTAPFHSPNIDTIRKSIWSHYRLTCTHLWLRQVY